MKVPFRVQISEYDCAPTTILNGLSYLFERSEIPPEVIQRTYMYCLDYLTKSQKINGTSGYAIQLLSIWLNNYKKSKFQVTTTYLEYSAVDLSPMGQITQTLNNGGVALLRVKLGSTWHYILGLSIADEWLNAFDPYLKSKRRSTNKNYEFIDSKGGYNCNLRIKCKYLNTKSDKKRYCLGLDNDREALLIERSTSKSR